MKRDYLITSINLSLARAAWWTAYANTPANLARQVHQGTHDGPLLGPDALIDSAMRTADNHLSNAQDMLDVLNTLES